MLWLVMAVLSAIFAGLTAVLAKCGIKKTDSDIATALRTIVVLIFSWIMVFIVGSADTIMQIDDKSLLFLILSGAATGASWVCYFKALSVGDVNKVVSVDKSSTILSVLLAIILFGETMCGAYESCMGQIQNEEKLERWEDLIVKDKDTFLKVILQKYVKNKLSIEKVEQAFQTLDTTLEKNDKFITAYVDVDLSYKITNSLDYEAKKFAMLQLLENYIGVSFFYWAFESEENAIIFIIKALSGESVITLKQLFEMVKEKDYPVVAAISKPYKGIEGIKKSYNEAAKLFELACMSGASAFTMPEELEEDVKKAHSEDYETMILNAIRRNDVKELKEGFIHFIYGLPEEEERQMYEIHRIMLKTESMLRNSYGITEELMDQYQKYYSNIQKLTAGKSIDVCYKILCNVIEKRKEKGCGNETKFFKEYMSEAVAYIEEHLNEEDLSIVSVANHVFLNSVYFGRIFKNTFHMTFKKYLMERRMERAKRLLEEGKVSIGAICEQVGIGNSSYFSHLFKEYTGKLPSEYKKEHDL